MYGTVLVATDGSEIAARAATRGVALADALGADVHVLSVADVRDRPGWTDVRETERERAAHAVDAVADEAVERGISTSTSVREGRPHREIVAAAERRDADLLVLGTHGRTGLRRRLLGSVATSVIQDAPCPVLTVGAAATDGSRRIDELLVATDGRPGANAAVEQGIELADTIGVTVHALSVVDDVHSRLSVVLDAFEQVATEATAEIVDRAAKRGVEAVAAVEHGVPHERIVKYAGDEGVDLIVMGTESRTGLDRVAFGSVSQRVVATAPVPVLTVRATE